MIVELLWPLKYFFSLNFCFHKDLDIWDGIHQEISFTKCTALQFFIHHFNKYYYYDVPGSILDAGIQW